ncbi:MAG: nucleotidyltransferase domain-containing protein [Paracoccaceae bacterium]
MQQDFINAVAAGLEDEARVLALFLAGSYGAGAADAFSDIDFVAVAAAEDHAGLADRWRGLIAGLEPVVFWMGRSGRVTLLNAVTESWLRVDLLIVTPNDLGQRSKAGVKALIDRAGLYEGLPDVLPAATPNAERAAGTINEFIRIMGLLPVGLGRGEYVLLVKVVGLLRDLLMDLMLEDCPLADRGGALHPGRLLTPGQMAVLEGLHYPGPEREAVIAAHQGVAAAFFPLAREMTGRLGLAWPDAFEAALWRRLADVPGMARV